MTNVCIIVFCQILAGTLNQCEAGTLTPFYLEEAKTKRECRELYQGLGQILPANLRLVQFDWARVSKTQLVEGIAQ